MTACASGSSNRSIAAASSARAAAAENAATTGLRPRPGLGDLGRRLRGGEAGGQVLAA